ncbi:hypothetical protein ACWGB8_29320 [Kitasatospora sp. NPDC054939]
MTATPTGYAAISAAAPAPRRRQQERVIDAGAGADLAWPASVWADLD